MPINLEESPFTYDSHAFLRDTKVSNLPSIYTEEPSSPLSPLSPFILLTAQSDHTPFLQVLVAIHIALSELFDHSEFVLGWPTGALGFSTLEYSTSKSAVSVILAGFDHSVCCFVGSVEKIRLNCHTIPSPSGISFL